MLVNLDHKRLDLMFLWSLLLTLTAPTLLPSARLLFFAPFLVVVCYQKPLQFCLWMAFLCGFIVDLLSSHTHFGLHTLDFCLSLALIYTQRRNFFADSLSTLPLMTFFFSALSTLLMGALLQSIEMHPIFSARWLFADVLVMPACDAAYAFCCFVLPALLLGRRRRPGKDYFLSR